MKFLFALLMLSSTPAFASSYEDAAIASMSPEARELTERETKRVEAEIEAKARELAAEGGEDKLEDFLKWLAAQYNVGQDLQDLKTYGTVVFISYCRADVLQYSTAMGFVVKIIASHSARIACMSYAATMPAAEGCFLLGRILGEVGGKWIGMHLHPFVVANLCKE